MNNTLMDVISSVTDCTVHGEYDTSSRSLYIINVLQQWAPCAEEQASAS